MTAIKRLVVSACVAMALLVPVAWVWFDNFYDGVETRDAVDLDNDANEDDSEDDAKILQALEAKGAYLARAGNCVTCHTQPGGEPYAGGRAFETPFGRVYASNLTPDESTGIGKWNTQHFWRALHHGRSYDGRLLTPVFPYNHTTLITRDDADALFAYLISLPPVNQRVPEHALRWPYGTQAALALWRSLNFKPSEFKALAHQSNEWNRGAYLVQALGHCAACHSTRNDMGAYGAADELRGGMMWGANWYAPSLVNDKETQLANTSVLETMRLLQTGRNQHAWITGPMKEVVQHSLQYLTPSDLRAMAGYLQTETQNNFPNKSALGLAQKTQATAWQTPVSAASKNNGAKLYEQHCATCHGKQGEGLEDVYPALARSTAVQMPDPTNLVQGVMYGGFSVTTSAQPRPYGMPPFLLVMSDNDMADVLTYIRQRWGNQAPPVSQLDVAKVRGTSTRAK